MTVIATASNPRFSVSRVDIDRGGPTYTVDTLRDLRAQRGPDADFFFITGADALGQIFSWRDADELLEMAHFVGCTRPGHTLADPASRSARPRWWRSRRWPSRRRRAGNACAEASRCGIWFQTASSSTSTSARCTSLPRRRHERNRTSP